MMYERMAGDVSGNRIKQPDGILEAAGPREARSN